MQATGEFSVELQPLESHATGKAGVQLGRMSIDKQFSGELEGTSIGEMLTAMTAVEGSAGYVAIEQVSGTLKGKKGTFVLQHYGLASQDGNSLTLEVVPNSGTGQLERISGNMIIDRQEEKHRYTFNYSLP